MKVTNFSIFMIQLQGVMLGAFILYLIVFHVMPQPGQERLSAAEKQRRESLVPNLPPRDDELAAKPKAEGDAAYMTSDVELQLVDTQAVGDEELVDASAVPHEGTWGALFGCGDESLEV